MADESEKKPTLMITGAQGLTGRYLRLFLRDRYQLISVDQEPVVPELEGEQSFNIDLADRSQVKQMFADLGERAQQIDGILHLAAYYDFSGQWCAHYDRYLEGLDELLNQVEAHCSPDTRFLFAHCMSALQANSPGKLMTEEQERFRGWPYPKSKAMAEDLIRNHSAPQKKTMLIFGGIYTDFCEIASLFQVIEIYRMAGVEKYVYPVPLDSGLTYVHIQDVIQAVDCALSYESKSSLDTFLIGEEKALSFREIREACNEGFYGQVIPAIPVPPWLAKICVNVLDRWGRLTGSRRFLKTWIMDYSGGYFQFDLSHTKEVMGWEPRFSVHDALKRFIDIAKKDTLRWTTINEQRLPGKK